MTPSRRARAAGAAFGPACFGSGLPFEGVQIRATDVPIAPAELVPRQLPGLDQLAQTLRCHLDLARRLAQEHQIILHARIVLGLRQQSSTPSAC